MPRCRNCKAKFDAKRFNQKFCDFCKVEEALYNLDEIKKKQSKEWRKRKAKKKEELMTLSDHLKKAQIVFNKYIRLRDKGKVCISCQKPAKKENAGHYFNANNHYNVRFNEDNVHLQCEACNTSLSGNLIEYRKHLINKIGTERFEHLESIARITRKFTKKEVKEIEKKYKEKIKT